MTSRDKLNCLISTLPADQTGSASPSGDQILQGMTFVAKDNIETADLPTTGGCPFLKDYQPTQDAEVVKRLRQAGAMLVGKANVHELGFGVTSNNGGFGPVRNPHNLGHTPGGSSGGTAAAVAGGIVPFGLATDTGGSARIPAAFCGVYGFRPSVGRYPHTGVLPLSPTRDTIGIMARCVADIQVVDQVITAGKDHGQSMNADNLKIGVPRAFFYENLSPGVSEAAQKALATIRSAGVTLIDCEVDRVGELDEAAGFPIALFEARREWTNFLAEKGLGSLDDLRAGLASPDVADIFTAMIEEAPIPQAVYLDALNNLRPQLQTSFQQTFAGHGLDAIVFPTVVMTAPPLWENVTMMHNGETVPVFATISRNTSPGSVAGIPGLTMPVGQDGAGLPVGLEIDGPAGSDERLLEVGRVLSELFQPVVPPVSP